MKTIEFKTLESLLTKCVRNNHKHEVDTDCDSEVYFECDSYRIVFYGSMTVRVEGFTKSDNTTGFEDVYVIDIDRVIELDDNDKEHELKFNQSQLSQIDNDIKVLINEH